MLHTSRSLRLIPAAALLLVSAAAILVFIFCDSTDPALVITSLALAFFTAIAGMLLFFKATAPDAGDHEWKTLAGLSPESRRLLNWTNGFAITLVLCGTLVSFKAAKNSYLESAGYFLSICGAIVPYIVFRLLRKE